MACVLNGLLTCLPRWRKFAPALVLNYQVHHSSRRCCNQVKLGTLSFGGKLLLSWRPSCPTTKITDERHPSVSEFSTGIVAAHSVHRLVIRSFPASLNCPSPGRPTKRSNSSFENSSVTG